MINRVECSHKHERGLVMKVHALASHCLMRFGQQIHRFAPAVAPFLAARDAALAFGKIALRLAVAAGREDARAICQCGERL